MDKINLAVVGSHKYTNKKRVYEILDLYRMRINKIISGGASGVDTFAENYADEYHIDKQIIRAEWIQDGKFIRSAGTDRNPYIIEPADEVLIIWDGKSPGTKDDIKLCEKMSKPYIIFYV